MIHANIEFVQGSQGPKYTDTTELTLGKVVITEQGMQSGAPLVDLVLVGPGGHQYLIVTTGRILIAIAEAIKGTNLRNHGKEEI